MPKKSTTDEGGGETTIRTGLCELVLSEHGPIHFMVRGREPPTSVRHEECQRLATGREENGGRGSWSRN